MPAAIAADPLAKAEDAVRRITTISTLPEVTARIIETVENPRASAADLRQIVSHDPALVTRILKVVNSSFYGLSSNVLSVDRAIVLLGLNAVKNIAVAASLGQLFRTTRLCEGFTTKDLWAHCVAVAVAARELARQMNLPIADEAFLAGMIHDVGILVSLQVWPEQLREVCETARNEDRPFQEIEMARLGVDHQQLGLSLSRHWRFPRSCQQAAGHHHDLADLDDEHRSLVSIVHVADVICCQSKHGFNLTARCQTINTDVVDPQIAAKVAGELDSLISAATPLVA